MEGKYLKIETIFDVSHCILDTSILIRYKLSWVCHLRPITMAGGCLDVGGIATMSKIFEILEWKSHKIEWGCEALVYCNSKRKITETRKFSKSMRKANWQNQFHSFTRHRISSIFIICTIRVFNHLRYELLSDRRKTSSIFRQYFSLIKISFFFEKKFVLSRN